MAASGVTIVDIARALGISKTAVSSALHGRGRVSEETRQRVLAQAEAMGYQSNRAAQRLRGGQHGAIGLHLPADLRELAFYMEFTFLRTAATGGSPRPEVDGLLVVDPTPDTFSDAVRGLGGVPVVAVGEYRGPGSAAVTASIAADHRGLIGQVLDDLSERGAERPALAALEEQREPLWASDVVAGYRDWCSAHGAESLVLRVPVAPTDAEIKRALAEVETAGHDALVWVAQSVVPHALALQARGHGTGIKLGTMAVDPGAARAVGVDLRPRAYGRAAAELLLGVLAGTVAVGAHEVHMAELVGPT